MFETSRTVRLSRWARFPDRIRLERYRRLPELGPRVLFFSGGSALRELSRALTNYTHHSIHLITPFDSGGSSAVLRRHFGMPSVGDLRNRLMALADHTVQGNPEIYALFSYRFPREADGDELRERLRQMIYGVDPLVAVISDPLRKIIRNHLKYFQDEAGPEFDLRGASIGNLILAGGYLNNGRHLDPVAYLFSKLVEVRGIVRTVVAADLHLAATLADGSRVIGQHLITGKEQPPPASPIADLALSGSAADLIPAEIEIRDKTRELISRAELICFPMGSFYSSVLATILPRGVGAAVRANPCPKVYIPNTGFDPEMRGLDVAAAAHRLIDYLGRGEPQAAGRLIDYVILDEDDGHYPGGIDRERIAATGAEIVRLPLVTPESAPGLDAQRLLATLLSLT